MNGMDNYNNNRKKLWMDYIESFSEREDIPYLGMLRKGISLRDYSPSEKRYYIFLLEEQMWFLRRKNTIG